MHPFILLGYLFTFLTIYSFVKLSFKAGKPWRGPFELVSEIGVKRTLPHLPLWVISYFLLSEDPSKNSDLLALISIAIGFSALVSSLAFLKASVFLYSIGLPFCLISNVAEIPISLELFENYMGLKLQSLLELLGIVLVSIGVIVGLAFRCFKRSEAKEEKCRIISILFVVAWILFMMAFL